MKRRAFAPSLLVLGLIVLAGGVRAASAEQPESVPRSGGTMRIEARFIDRNRGLEAGWDAAGQVRVPLPPADPALQRWNQEPTVATSLTRQSVTVAPGGRGLVRIGSGIPFATWFLRHGIGCGWLDEETKWREVESALEVEVASTDDDGIRLVLTPQFSYLEGNERRTVSYPGESVEVALAPGRESRLAPPEAREEFYQRLLAGYDPLRRVWPVDLLLRSDPAVAKASAEP